MMATQEGSKQKDLTWVTSAQRRWLLSETLTLSDVDQRDNSHQSQRPGNIFRKFKKTMAQKEAEEPSMNQLAS